MQANNCDDDHALLIERFLYSLLSQHGLLTNTIDSYRYDLQGFVVYLETHAKKLNTAKRSDIQYYLLQRLEQNYTPRSNTRLLSALRKFYAWMTQNKMIEENPCTQIHSSRHGRYLPQVLSEEEVVRLLEAADPTTPEGLRNKAMLELLYACGLRVSELVNLSFSQLSQEGDYVRVTGKGNKERLVPFGEQAYTYLRRYLTHARPHLLKGKPCNYVFISRRGRRMTRQTFWHAIKLLAKTAQITKAISPHTIRHAFATHMVNHGADLRVVQLLLGHSDLSTTQIYTQVAKQRLKDLHQLHHPRS